MYRDTVLMCTLCGSKVQGVKWYGLTDRVSGAIGPETALCARCAHVLSEKMSDAEWKATDE